MTDTHGGVLWVASFWLLSFIVFLVAVVLSKLVDHVNDPLIKNIPAIPGIPIFGNLLQLGDNHAKVAQDWSQTYGPVFQVRLGNRRIVFANSFDSVRQLWVNNQSALIDRPKLHTFHTVVSSSEGFTIGTSPWDASCKARRKAAATALNRPAVQSYMPIIDYESTKSIKEMLVNSRGGTADLDPNPYFSRYALSTSLMLTYGIKIEGNVEDQLLREITHVERQISNFRSTANNWADYIPLLRLWPGNQAKPLEYKGRRAAYMTKLLDMLKTRIRAGTDKPCITGNVLKDAEAKLNEAEVMSICLTMVSAGLDTVPANLIMCIAYLSSSHGQDIQARALLEMQRTWPAGDAWTACLQQNNGEQHECAYITALVKETLRFWSVIPICLPRTSTRPIKYGDAEIPAGTSFYMNAYAAHYDADHFKAPYEFYPDRFLRPAPRQHAPSPDACLDHDASHVGTPHYAYGAGSRMCVGSHLANRELYVAFVRLICAFEILPPSNPKDQPVLDAVGCNLLPNGLTTDPRPFKVGLRARNAATLATWIDESERRTAGL